MLHTRTGSPRLAGTSLGLAFVASLILFSSQAHATTVRGLSLYEKTQIAEVIVRAEVISVSVGWAQEGQSARTLVSFRVREPLKGKLKTGETFVLLQAGGKIGDFEHHIPGMSEFRAGEEAILFLEGYQNYLVEIGVGIGKYGIEADASGEKVVTHDPKVALVTSGKDGATQIEDARPMTPELIGKFILRVRDYVTGTQKPAAPHDDPPGSRPTRAADPIPGKK